MTARKNAICVLAGTMIAVTVLSSSQLALAADEFVVEYRTTAWRTAHFDDAKSAGAHQSTVSKLGCEVKTGAHQGHFDVSYLCPQWRRLVVKKHDEAHQWEKWLKTNGFETRHNH